MQPTALLVSRLLVLAMCPVIGSEAAENILGCRMWLRPRKLRYFSLRTLQICGQGIIAELEGQL
jgi:hypothetical protein